MIKEMVLFLFIKQHELIFFISQRILIFFLEVINNDKIFRFIVAARVHTQKFQRKCFFCHLKRDIRFLCFTPSTFNNINYYLGIPRDPRLNYSESIQVIFENVGNVSIYGFYKTTTRKTF